MYWNSLTLPLIALALARSVPWIGQDLADFFFAVKFPSAATIPRFHAYHVVLLPLALIFL